MNNALAVVVVEISFATTLARFAHAETETPFGAKAYIAALDVLAIRPDRLGGCKDKGTGGDCDGSTNEDPATIGGFSWQTGDNGEYRWKYVLSPTFDIAQANFTFGLGVDFGLTEHRWMDGDDIRSHSSTIFVLDTHFGYIISDLLWPRAHARYERIGTDARFKAKLFVPIFYRWGESSLFLGLGPVADYWYHNGHSKLQISADTIIGGYFDR